MPQWHHDAQGKKMLVLLHQQLFLHSSFNRRVEASVVSMGKLLYEVKGGGQGVAISKSEINAAADAVLEPLMDLLEGSLTTYAKICDESVLKRLLKELWKIVIRSLEKNIVLPPAQDKSVRILFFFSECRNVCFNFPCF